MVLSQRERFLALQASCKIVWGYLALSSIYLRSSSKPFGMTLLINFFIKKWLKLVQDTRKVEVVELKRHYFRGSSSADLPSVQLRRFGDASDKAYGPVVYLRFQLISGIVFTQLNNGGLCGELDPSVSRVFWELQSPKN